MSTDGCLHLATARKRPHHQGQILAAHGPGLQLVDQRGVRLEGLGHHHQPTGVAIEPVHDATARHPRQRRVVVQQRVLQRPGRVARPGMNHQAGGFVDHNKGRILVDDIKRNGLGQHRPFVGLPGIDDHRLAAGHRGPAPGRGTIDGQVTGFQPALQPRSRELREKRGQRDIKPVAGGALGDDGLSLNALHHCGVSVA
jgi:hypothetical protein